MLGYCVLNEEIHEGQVLTSNEIAVCKNAIDCTKFANVNECYLGYAKVEIPDDSVKVFNIYLPKTIKIIKKLTHQEFNEMCMGKAYGFEYMGYDRETGQYNFIEPIKIGFRGFAGSGKSTATNLIIRNNPYLDIEEKAFAQPIKQMVQTLFNIDKKYLYDPQHKEQKIEDLGVSARQLLTIIGTELFRNTLKEKLPQLKLVGDNVWIHNLVTSINPNENYIVSDVRFDDEYEALKKLGFVIIKINRPKCVAGSHASEQEADKFDYEITNDSTKEDLYNKLLNIC